MWRKINSRSSGGCRASARRTRSIAHRNHVNSVSDLGIALLVQWGWNRAGFYSYDLLDNLGRPSARQILPQFQQLAAGDWVPMGGKTTPYTAYRVARLEPGKLMLWQKGGGTWLWLLEPDGTGRTRLITRLRSRYA